MAANKIQKLPSFDNPPVIEVVIGVQFESLSRFHIPHVGVLWDCLDRKKYPTCEEVAPLHGYEDERVIVYEKPPMPRIWFIGEDQSSVVQFQKDRFLYNWRKNPDPEVGKPYPRYSKVIKGFYDNIQNFQSCIKSLDIEAINPQRLEISYINIIPLELFGGAANIGKILKDVSWMNKNRALPEPHRVNVDWQFKVKKISALLDLRINTAQVQKTGEEILRIELTVKGQAPHKDIRKCRAWFDTAHETIVTGFKDITTANAHKMWGLQ